MFRHLLEAESKWHTCLNGCGQSRSNGLIGFGFWRRALEGFGDDVSHRNPCTEQARRDFRHLGVALDLSPISRHRGRGTNADQMLGQRLANPAHQQGHVGTLAATVGMELIKHQKTQTLRIRDHLLVDGVLPCQQQLQHHEVGQQDIGRVGFHDLALFRAFLSREAAKGHSPGARVCAQELLEFFELAVGQRVHRVDDDGSGTRCLVRGLGLEAGIDDRDEVGQ